MITGTYTRTVTIQQTTIVPPLLMQILRLKYNDAAWAASQVIPLEYEDTRSLQAILRAATVLLPLTNLEKEKQTEFLKKLEDMILHLRDREGKITIDIVNKK